MKGVASLRCVLCQLSFHEQCAEVLANRRARQVQRLKLDKGIGPNKITMSTDLCHLCAVMASRLVSEGS